MKERKEGEDQVLNKAYRERFLQFLLRHELKLLTIAYLFGVWTVLLVQYALKD